MKNTPDVLSFTRKLISFNTINPPGQERECAHYIGRLLEDAGFKTGYYDFAEGRTSLVARMGSTGEKPPICFSGHIDTVPLGDAEWSVDPFTAEIDGKKIYGRGSSDMKSGLAAMVVAAIGLAAASKGKINLLLVITAGEETACRGASYLAGLGNVLGKAGAMVVCEPTSNYPLVGHKGAMWLKAYTTGVTAHASMPEQGDNAIYKAARAVEKLRQFDFNIPDHPILGRPTLSVGTIRGGININSVPDKAVIGIDIRTIPGNDNDAVFTKLQSYLGEEATLQRLADVGGVFTDPQDAWIQQVFKIMGPYNEGPLELRGAAYVTDGSMLAPAFDNPPTIFLGPGEPEMSHKTDEFCYVSRIEDAVEAYTEIIKKWCDK